MGSTQLGLTTVAKVKGSELVGFWESDCSVRKGAHPVVERKMKVSIIVALILKYLKSSKKKIISWFQNETGFTSRHFKQGISNNLIFSPQISE